MLITMVDYALHLAEFLRRQVDAKSEAATALRDGDAATIREKPGQGSAKKKARRTQAVLIEECDREDLAVDAAEHARSGLVLGMAGQIGHGQGFPVEALLFP